MITRKELEHLANLARIKIKDEELESLTGEIDSILGYMSQIQNMPHDGGTETPLLRNVMREDVVTHTPKEFTEDLLNLAPEREGDYITVKKIL